MNNITLDNIIDFFTFQNIIIILLVIIGIYILIKIQQIDSHKNNKENFYTDNVNLKSINNLGEVCNEIINEDIVNIYGNLEIMGDNNIVPKGTIILYDVTNREPPKGWALCDGTCAWLDNEGNTNSASCDESVDDLDKIGYIRTPSFLMMDSIPINDEDNVINIPYYIEL